ncbi:MAG: peptidylprolyl isomerase [Caldilineales bacterium]|nr:peptidylprolyl isomerase [Caldilineales bacterium]
MDNSKAQPQLIADGCVVSLAYQLRLDDGEVVDESGADEPLEFLQGSGEIISGLENELYGMKLGQERDITITSTDGYGEYDPDNKVSLPRDSFPPDLTLEEGMGLRMRDSQTDEVITAYISSFSKTSVHLDLNHPLAGETLHFHVQVVGIRHATDKEIAHDHAHAAGHRH